LCQSGGKGTVVTPAREGACLSLSLKIRSVLAVALVVLASRVAVAEPRLFVKLEYESDPSLSGCPSAADFAALVTKQLSYDPFRAESNHRVVARAEPSGDGLRGFVRWYDATGAERGERELRANDRDCAAFARAMGFAIAVQVQLMNTEQALATGEGVEKGPDTRPPASGGSPVTPPGVRRAAPRPAARTPARDERASAEYLLGLGPGVGLGLAPRAVAQGRIFAEVRTENLGLELGAEAILPSRRETANGEGFEQRITLGSVAGCVSLGVLFGCALQKLGVLEVQGFGVDVPRAPAGFVAQSGIRLGVGHRLGAHAFGALRVEALFALTRWEVVLNRRQVWTAPPVSLTFGGDLAVLFR
jgi:hypothetical protein